MGNEPSVEAINLLTEMFLERIAQPELNSIESWAKRVLTETNAIDFAALATENTDLKRQLAASANAYGKALEDAEACNAATEEVQKEIVRAREKIAQRDALQARLDEAVGLLEKVNWCAACGQDAAAFIAAQREEKP